MTRTMSTVISPANRGRTCREQDLQRGVFWVNFLTAMRRERSSGETDSFWAVLRIAPSLRSASFIFPALLLLLLLWCLWFECMWPFILAVRTIYLKYSSITCRNFWKTFCHDGILTGDIPLTFTSRISAVDYIWFLLKVHCQLNMQVHYITLKSILLLSIPFHIKFTFSLAVKRLYSMLYRGFQHFLKKGVSFVEKFQPRLFHSIKYRLRTPKNNSLS